MLGGRAGLPSLYPYWSDHYKKPLIFYVCLPLVTLNYVVCYYSADNFIHISVFLAIVYIHPKQEVNRNPKQKVNRNPKQKVNSNPKQKVNSNPKQRVYILNRKCTFILNRRHTEILNRKYTEIQNRK